MTAAPMSNSTSPHDALFKKVFGQPDHTGAALRTMLPAALGMRVSWPSLKRCAGSFVDTLLADSHSDLLFSAEIGGKPGLLYFIFEHQSSVDDLMPLRLMKYVVRVLEAHVQEAHAAGQARLPLPVVIPAVLHHSERGWTAATKIEALFDQELAGDPAIRPFIPHMSFALDDLSHLSDAELAQRA